MQVSAEAARRFLVARQLLAPARTLEGGPDAVLEFLRRFGSIQFDPIAVAGRSHDLVLHARVAGYDAAWSDLLYERRELFEAVNKGLSFVLMRDYPWFRGTSSLRSSRLLAENAEVAERVLERVRTDGPLSALDFERERGAAIDWFGVKTNVVRAVLEAYAVTGVLGLARRDGNRRYYDLIERLVPRNVLEDDVPLRERLRHKMLSRYRAHGLLGASSGGGVFGDLGPAKPDPRYPEYAGRTVLREELIEDGELVPVEVEGVRGSASSFATRSTCWPRLRSRPLPRRFSRRSIRWCGTACFSDRCSSSTTYGTSSTRPRSGASATTSSRSSSATASSAGSSQRSTVPAGPCRYSASGGRTASRRAAPTASSMRCAPLSAHTSASQGLTGSNGRPISARRSGSFPRGLEVVRLIPPAAAGTTTRAYDCRMKAVLVFTVALVAAGSAMATLSPPARVTLDGVAGARPGMSVAAVSAVWGVRLRPSYEVRPTCGTARIELPGIEGEVMVMPRGRFGAVYFRKGVVTGRGIRIGSTLAQLRRAYPKLSSRPDKYIHGSRNYFLRRARAPHWELRFDVSPASRVRQIAFGERTAVRLVEGCA